MSESLMINDLFHSHTDFHSKRSLMMELFSFVSPILRRNLGKLRYSTPTARVEKTIANEIVSHEVHIENDVSKKLNTIIDSHISTVQKQKRVVAKCHQDNEAAKQKHQVSDPIRAPPSKPNLL